MQEVVEEATQTRGTTNPKSNATIVKSLATMLLNVRLHNKVKEKTEENGTVLLTYQDNYGGQENTW